MNKLWTVAWREYYYNLRRPAFLFTAFGTPLIVVASILFSVASADDGVASLSDYGQVGYVDLSTEQILSQDIRPSEDSEQFVAYSDDGSARAALDAGELTAYFSLPDNYMATGRVNIYTYETIPEVLESTIKSFLIANLSADLETDLPIARVGQPVNDITVVLADSGREVNEGGVIFLLLMPLFFATILLISSTTTSGFLMSGLVEEKTNRVIEVLVTSVTPMQLLTGKIVGLFLLGLTQILILLVVAIVGIWIAQQSDSLSGIVFPLDLAVLGVIYYLLSYFILASVMAGVGAIAGSEQESRQLSVFITLPFMLPLFFIVNFFTDPNGNLSVFLSLFPLTAPMAVLMRVGITAVPAWQIILSILLMVITSVVLVWAAAKIFRWGLLLYGKRLNPLELLRVLLRRNPPAMVTSVPQSNEGNTP